MIFFKTNLINYCFVHIPKTAGTSLEKTINKNNLDNSIYNLKFNKFMEIYMCKHTHIPFYFIKDVFLKKANISEEIKFISIISNPWDRLASLFEQEMLREKVGLATNIQKKDIRNVLTKDYHQSTESFIEKLDLRSSHKIKDFFKYWLFYLGFNRKVMPNLNPNFNITPQSWWLFDYIQNEKVNHIYMFENLEELETDFNIKLLKENKKKKYLKYSDYYCQETIDYVYNLDKYVIDIFGYDFNK